MATNLLDFHGNLNLVSFLASEESGRRAANHVKVKNLVACDWLVGLTKITEMTLQSSHVQRLIVSGALAEGNTLESPMKCKTFSLSLPLGAEIIQDIFTTTVIRCQAACGHWPCL
ncbi:hypothetical protein E2C01_049576 [Portunus trituberculatus]|uniref:Uncharacterized protein n=1 Tax=Portunus trituberculatus TaxID=210409 RepID=A0A5B7GEA9_PORTR|nr:hypothetical protein [Portunus trituberculatus]